MALQQSCRSAIARSRQAYRLIPSRANYSTTTTSSEPQQSATQNLPRWSQTPAGMKAPVQMHPPKNPENRVWAVNSNPEVLDQMYNNLLGPGGSKMLPEELKWLAVTHKSFDNGRRGFNDRLALLGRMTLTMETTKSIVSKAPLEVFQTEDGFNDRRQPFQNEALQSVDNLSVETTRSLISKEKIFALAADVGLVKVLRWKPRLPKRLEASGVEVVLNGAVLAIVGAITLQHGSAVASKVIQEKLLPRLRDI